MRLNSGPTGSHRMVHRRYTEGSHPGAPSFPRTRGTEHTRAAWVGGVSPEATTAVPLPPFTLPGSTHNLRRESARRSNQTSKQSQPHTDTPPHASGAAIIRHGPALLQSHSPFHTHDQRSTRLGHWWPTQSDVREDVRAAALST